MTITQSSVTFAPSFVLPDTISPMIAELLERARPSVVQVRSGGRGTGTGVIWRSNGAILTNDHVVAHADGRIQVLLAGGRMLEARVGARNADLDLALLEVAGGDLEAAAVGDSSQLRVGELVFAVGHPWGQPWVVTAGIVSGLGAVPVRSRHEGMGEDEHTAQYVRSDVRLAPGNSGGPLLNARGEVIGINAMIFGGDMAVAIPSHVASEWTVAPSRGRTDLGATVQLASFPPAIRHGAWASRRAALLVTAVAPGGPGERGGLRAGDLLLDAAGAPTESSEALHAALATHAAPVVRMYLLREDAIIPIDVYLGERGA
jgi:serine protease Do